MWRIPRVIGLALLLLLPATIVEAESTTSVITYPKEAIAIRDGSGITTALSIEDMRAVSTAGQTVDGITLVTPGDITASLYNYMAHALTAAGYHVTPYNPQLATGVVIHIRSIDYSSSRRMLKSKVEVKVTLDAMANGSDTTRTYRIAVEDQFAFSPSAEDNSAMLGNGLAAAAAAVLGDFPPVAAKILP